MLFKRPLIEAGTVMPAKMRAGDGLLGNPVITEKTTDTNHTITVAEISTGILYYSALSAGRNVTTPTAALILAAAPDMDIGDSFEFRVVIQDAFAITWVAGANVTLRGRTTTAASSSSTITVVKTSATTVDWFVG
jgi:hypothetical protein